MRRFVRNHIMRETAEDCPHVTCEVAEDQGLVISRIEGVRLGEGVRGDLELMARERPADPTPQSLLEARECGHCDRVDILLMKARIRHESVEVCDSGVGVLIRATSGSIETVVRRVVVDYIDPVATGARR